MKTYRIHFWFFLLIVAILTIIQTVIYTNSHVCRVFPERFKKSSPPKNKSSNSIKLCDPFTKLFILVPTRIDNYEIRSLIRNTYGRCLFMKSSPIRLLFFVGLDPHVNNTSFQHFLLEQRVFKDVELDATFQDTYRNLTRKILSGLQWSQMHCPAAEVIMKVDSDVFVYLDRLVTRLKTPLHTQKPFIMGYPVRGTSPLRDKNHKWYVSEEEYPFAKFPSYMNGPAYVLHREAVKMILNNFTIYQKTFNYSILSMEDVFITGVLLQHATILSRIADDGFYLDLVPPRIVRSFTLTVHYYPFLLSQAKNISNVFDQCTHLFEATYNIFNITVP